MLSALKILSILFLSLSVVLPAAAAPRKKSAKAKVTAPVPVETPKEVSGTAAAERAAVKSPTVTTNGFNAPVVPDTILGAAPPYVPRKIDYGLELGLFTTTHNNAFIGATMGRHVGHCIFSHSETCQQYLDIMGGAAVREAESYGIFAASARWQYVNFPDRASPFWRLFAGTSYVNSSNERSWKPVVGAGIGVTTYLHRNVDIRLEARSGMIDRGYLLGLAAVQIKTDSLLEYFALKLRDLGVGTVNTAIEATGTVIRATGEGLSGIANSVSDKSVMPDAAKEAGKGSPQDAAKELQPANDTPKK